MTERRNDKFKFRDKKQNTIPDLTIYGKVPPQAKEIEEAILGAILMEKNAIDRVQEVLKPQHFYVDSNRTIYAAMCDMRARSMPIDILTVVECLRKKEELDLVGGAYYITTLTNKVVSSSNIETHARIVLEKWIKRELIRMGGNLINRGFEDLTDVNVLIGEHEQEFTSLTVNREERMVMLDVALIEAIQKVVELTKQDDHMTGIASGFLKIDTITHGWQDSDLIILAARPAVGKTAFALNLARNATKVISRSSGKKNKVVFFSLEMSRGQLINRLMASESEIWLDKIQNGRLDENGMERLFNIGVKPLSTADIIIDDTPALDIYELRAKARMLKRKYDINMIIIDYLQLMSGDRDKKSGNREQEISTISRGIKGLAKELQIPIIALSQLSREPDKRKGDDKTPKLSDLRESGAIEQDADVVMFMYRPEYYGEAADEMGESTSGLTMISISKHRNGVLATGNNAIKLRADLAIQKFFHWDSLVDVKGSMGSGNWRPVREDDDGLI